MTGVVLRCCVRLSALLAGRRYIIRIRIRILLSPNSLIAQLRSAKTLCLGLAVRSRPCARFLCSARPCPRIPHFLFSSFLVYIHDYVRSIVLVYVMKKKRKYLKDKTRRFSNVKTV
jgi:hypothetical protein